MSAFVKTVGRLNAALPSDRQVRLTRTFDAPRQLVWDAHTKPELIRRWLLGPPGWTMPVCDVDLRVGGRFHYEWLGEGGKTMALDGIYRVVEEPGRIADTQTFDEDWTNGPADTDMVLTENSGVTEMILTITYTNQQTRDLVVSSPMMDGMEAGYERLDKATVDEK
jgi:uncharacterized protein YndB with AHSA1/START domain